jgi:PHD/YefM family antitoxin component YafN of YafNO toxin-antitoxin module
MSHANHLAVVGAHAPRVRYIVDEEGKRCDVVMSAEEYEELLEDLHDLSVIAKRRNEPTITLKELKRSFKADGLI